MKFYQTKNEFYDKIPNSDVFTDDIQPDETTKGVALKIKDKGELKPSHVSVTMVNDVSDCGKRIEHLLLESLDKPIEIEID